MPSNIAIGSPFSASISGMQTRIPTSSLDNRPYYVALRNVGAETVYVGGKSTINFSTIGNSILESSSSSVYGPYFPNAMPWLGSQNPSSVVGTFIPVVSERSGNPTALRNGEPQFVLCSSALSGVYVTPNINGNTWPTELGKNAGPGGAAFLTVNHFSSSAANTNAKFYIVGNNEDTTSPLQLDFGNNGTYGPFRPENRPNIYVTTGPFQISALSYHWTLITDGHDSDLVNDYTHDAPSILGLNLSGSYRFEEAVNSTFVFDYSESNNIMFYEACNTVENGIDGRGLELDGLFGYVYSPSFNWLSINNNDYSISMWVYPTTYDDTGGNPDVNQFLFANKSILNQIGTVIRMDGDNDPGSDGGIVRFQMKHSTAIAGAEIVSTKKLPLNEWSHIVAVRDTSSGCYLYINGELDGQNSYTQTSVLSNELNVSFGGRKPSVIVRNPFEGRMDEVLLINQALSQEDVLTIYNSRKTV
jgi:hypothetical protein